MIGRAPPHPEQPGQSPVASLVDRHATSEGRLFPTLHLLRVLAALSIFAGHWSEPYVAQLWPQGQLAIDVFFMIEGFLSMRLLINRSASESVGRRILDRLLHVYPAYAIGLVAGFCAFAPLAFAGEQGWAIGRWLSAFVSGLLLVPTFSTLVHGSVFPLNPPTWAIVLELIGFALLAAIRRSKIAVLSIWAGAVASFAILAMVWHDPNAGWATTHYWGGFPRMIFSFFGGAMLFPLFARFGGAIPRVSPVWICATFVAMQMPTVRFIGWPLLAIGVPILLSLAASSRRPAWSRVAGAWSARHALMIYILGYPIMMAWRGASPVSPSAAGIGLDFLLVCASLVIAATAINRAIASLFRRRETGDAATAAEQM